MKHMTHTLTAVAGLIAAASAAFAPGANAQAASSMSQFERPWGFAPGKKAVRLPQLHVMRAITASLSMA